MTTIAEQNDAFRRLATAGTVYVTAGIAAFSVPAQAHIFSKVCTFDAFTPDNDPYSEHDFGSFDFEDQKIFWKINCYDLNLEYGSPNPADPAVTRRVLIVMLAEEY